jgi:glycosyltransferase involved in cell wall biosynthesis
MDLPNITLITPTYNKHKFFKLAVHNFNSFNYPKEKIEWIILDDSDEVMKNILPIDPRIKYYYYDKNDVQELYKMFMQNYKENKKKYDQLSNKEKKGKKYKILPDHKNGNFKGGRIPLGLKRNLCVQYASNDIILHMDDDDYYLPDSIITRVLAIQNGNDCVGCSSINCFHITKMVSIIYNPNEKYTASYKKIIGATLGYKKSFWDKNRFENQDIRNETEHFLRKSKCFELESKNIIVALYHSKNDNNLFNQESNGWHFKPLSNELFQLITDLE